MYDALGKIIRTIFQDGSSLEREYDAAGNLIQSKDQRGHVTTSLYDALGRPISNTTAEATTTYEYAHIFGQRQRRDANGHTIQYAYNKKGQIVNSLFNDGTSISTMYDEMGRIKSRTDQNGRKTQYAYDYQGNLLKVTDALQHETSYTYDEVDNLIAQRDANGNTTQFEYDKLGRMITRILPEGMAETMAYDAEGHMLEKTDFNGNILSFEYDANGRVTRKDYPDGRTVEYTYTPDGSQKTITDSCGTTIYRYDDMGRLESRTEPDGKIISYTYDLAGNRTSVTTPTGTVTYTYDELNRLATVTDPSTGKTTYAYDHVGNLKSVTYPNDTKAEYTYDTLNRLINLKNMTSDGAIISSYTYTLDNAGNRTKVVEDHTGRVAEYDYDDTYKLLEERITNPDGNTSVINYTYDAVGNRLTKTENGLTTTYVYDSNNCLITEGDTTYHYDNNGNLIEKNSTEEQVAYFYDYENRLIRVETTKYGATIVVEYEYDTHGNRIKKTIDGVVTTMYFVDENRDYAQVLEERDGTGALIARYIYGHDLISQTRGGVISYYHYDGLGSTRALTTSSAAVTDTYTYDAFGKLLDQTGTTTNAYRYRGEQFDPELGFYYLRARYMNPAIGRFVTMDAFAGSLHDPYSLHKYLYANANPMTYSDPSGYLSYIQTVTAAAIVGVLGGITIGVLVAEIGEDIIEARDCRPIKQSEIDFSRKIIGNEYRGKHFDYNRVQINDTTWPLDPKEDAPPAAARDYRIFVSPRIRPILDHTKIFMHEMFHLFQHMFLTDRFHLIWQRMLYDLGWYEVYLSYSEFYDVPYMSLDDIPTYEGQADFVGEFANEYEWYEWDKTTPNPSIDRIFHLKRWAGVLSRSTLSSEAITECLSLY